MSEVQQVSLIELYKGWDTYQNFLVKSTAALSTDQLTLRAAPHLRSIAKIVGHIIDTRAWWFYSVMHEGGPELQAYYPWGDEDGPHLTTEDLLNGLHVTWKLITECLHSWTARDLEYIFHWRNNKQFSRQWIIGHVIEHDLQHAQELATILHVHSLASLSL